MSYQVKGVVTLISPVEMVGDNPKQVVVVESAEQYNNTYAFDVFGEKAVSNFEGIAEGSEVNVSFNIRCVEARDGGRYFTGLSPWKVEELGAQSVPPVPPAPAAVEAGDEGADDDLPF